VTAASARIVAAVSAEASSPARPHKMCGIIIIIIIKKVMI